MSKGRVSPLKKLTLHRLELMAAVIGARVGKYLSYLLSDLVVEFRFWTDSLIVLHWIKGCSKQWKQFVCNRVVKIQEKSYPKSWNHCSGRDNPADIVSRELNQAHSIIIVYIQQEMFCEEIQTLERKDQQQLVDLPVSRVNPGKAVSKSGVDFAGPFQVKTRSGRGVRALKTYDCIFVCFITKAVHPELEI
ncbi:integrase catalytic domain-containing protein [Trichonephila clavipes]|nr:integrase catalytic domain-containing protein [Trichonephila clavipes]